MQQNSRQKCSETETREHTVRHLFTLRVCVSAWRLEDKPPRRNRLKKNHSLVKQCLRRFRGCLIIKVQKSSNKPPASRASQQCCDSRESTSIFYGTETETKASKTRKGDGVTFPQGTTADGVIFQTSHRQSGVWRGPTSPSSESVSAAQSEAHAAF